MLLTPVLRRLPTAVAVVGVAAWIGWHYLHLLVAVWLLCAATEALANWRRIEALGDEIALLMTGLDLAAMASEEHRALPWRAAEPAVAEEEPLAVAEPVVVADRLVAGVLVTIAHTPAAVWAPVALVLALLDERRAARSVACHASRETASTPDWYQGRHTGEQPIVEANQPAPVWRMRLVDGWRHDSGEIPYVSFFAEERMRVAERPADRQLAGVR